MKNHHKIISMGLCLGLAVILCEHYVKAFTVDVDQNKEINAAIADPRLNAIKNQNTEAKQIFNDMQVFAVLSNELTKFFPEEKDIRGVKVPIRQIMQSIVGVLYNISELGLNIIDLIENQVEPLKNTVACLKYTEEDFNNAKQGKFIDEALRKCPLVGCGSKKACIAASIKKISLAIQTIFDPAVVKYNPETGTSQRGLIMNIDLVIDQIVKLLLQTNIVRDALNKAISGGTDKAQTFVANIDKLRTLVMLTAQAFSGILKALMIVSGQLAPESITPEEAAILKDALIEANKEKQPDIQKLDDLLLEFDE